jgi:dUTP pyrophosphatase
MKVKIKKLCENAVLPTYGSLGAAGADLYACLDKDLSIGKGETVLVRTGVQMAIPEGYVGLVYARSGLASKRGLAPANKVGVIDSDYRGEILVALYNQSGQVRTVSKGDRIAQLVIEKVETPVFEEVDELPDTERGAGGFGSTGR